MGFLSGFLRSIRLSETTEFRERCAALDAAREAAIEREYWREYDEKLEMAKLREKNKRRGEYLSAYMDLRAKMAARRHPELCPKASILAELEWPKHLDKDVWLVDKFPNIARVDWHENIIVQMVRAGCTIVHLEIGREWDNFLCKPDGEIVGDEEQPGHDYGVDCIITLQLADGNKKRYGFSIDHVIRDHVLLLKRAAEDNNYDELTDWFFCDPPM